MPETTDEVEAALAGASSPSWPRRARAGQVLVSHPEVPEAAEALAGLLLDAGDTAVARRTAEALARVGTVAAVRLVARTLAEADDSHADWIQAGVHDAVAEADGVPGIAAVCVRLARDGEAAVRQGAAEILAWAGGAPH
ncbi:hypothetical protein AB0467_07835 [Streptomyces sp. NPDC052095]|uniref:hypothetical protein n=1 Tax=unclassified Streptomyces TaxID=2593676 RepID=UPI00344E6C6D